MAISASFKQQCPSCEALVPIKDGSLIGKKVDCPKCKYRFVVEDPVAKDKKAVAAKGKAKKPADDEVVVAAVEDDDEDVVEAEVEVEQRVTAKPKANGK